MKRKDILEGFGRRSFSSYHDELRQRDDDEQRGMEREKRSFKRSELSHELGHESNNIQVVINGRPWKVLPGRGRADSMEERKFLRSMEAWAAKKSAQTGKEWKVHLTGANPTTEQVTPALGTPEQGKLKTVDTVKKTATVTTPTGDKEVPMQNLTQDPKKPGGLTAKIDAADKSQLKPGAPVSVTTVAEAPDVPYFVDTSSGTPMAKTTPKPTTIVPSDRWPAITPEIEAKASAQGFRKVMLQANGKTFAGLEGGDQKLGTKIIVSQTDYQALSRPTQEGVELDSLKKLAGL